MRTDDLLKGILLVILASVLVTACASSPGQVLQSSATSGSTPPEISPSATLVIEPTRQPSPSPLPSTTPPPTATTEPSPTASPTTDPTPSSTPTDEGYFYGLFPCLPTAHAIQSGTVNRVIDGDTVVITASDGITYTIRYIGIDAPEIGRPFSEQASDVNRQLVLGQPVILIQDFSENDQYGRLLRYVVSGERFVNQELVSQGLASAQSWPPDVACDDAFSAAEQNARQAMLGMWAATMTPEPSAPKLVIIAVNKREEWVDLQNQGENQVDLTGWNLVSERGHQECPLSGTLAAGATLRIWAMVAQGPGYSCGYTSPIWNNSETDPAVLYDPQGVEVSRK
jgi:micrococcal nuclease